MLDHVAPLVAHCSRPRRESGRVSPPAHELETTSLTLSVHESSTYDKLALPPYDGGANLRPRNSTSEPLISLISIVPSGPPRWSTGPRYPIRGAKTFAGVYGACC